MTTWAKPGSTFTATSEDAPSGLVGTIGVRIANPATQADVVARSTTGISEYPAGSGLYAAQLVAPNTSGTYEIIWDTGGIDPVYASDDLYVSASNPASLPADGDLCTLADVKLAAGIPDSRDEIVQTCITQASKALVRRYRREFAPVAGTPTRRVTVNGRLVNLSPYDLRSATSMVFDPDGTALTLATRDYILRPRNSLTGTYRRIVLREALALTGQTMLDFGEGELAITGTWGMEEIPEDVNRAAVVTAAAWTDRAAAEYGLDSDGTPGAISAAMAQTWALPRAAQNLMNDFESFFVE